MRRCGPSRRRLQLSEGSSICKGYQCSMTAARAGRSNARCASSLGVVLIALLVVALLPRTSLSETASRSSASAQKALDQTVLEVLVGLASNNRGALESGLANLATTMRPPDPLPEGHVLPACQRSGVLLRAGGFPTHWAQLSAHEQAAHPINLVMFMLGAAVYHGPSTFSACLDAMGVTGLVRVQEDVPEFSSTRTAFVMRAGAGADARIFVAIKGSSVSDITINIACGHTTLDGSRFGVPGTNVSLHRGFWRGWEVLEQGVVAAVKRFLPTVPSGEIYVLGHSLGAASAGIAAARLHVLLAQSAAEAARPTASSSSVKRESAKQQQQQQQQRQQAPLAAAATPHIAGVWLLASPRIGDPEWAAAYSAALGNATLRITNVRDFAARLPYVEQSCSVGGIDLTAQTARYGFSHIGRHLLMCPIESSGLTEWRVFQKGGEAVDCGPPGTFDELDASGTTHQLSSYFDAWRRGYRQHKGDDGRDDARVRAVMCANCTIKADTLFEKLGLPARSGGPITCTSDASCRSRVAFEAATAVGNTTNALFSNGSACGGFICR